LKGEKVSVHHESLMLTPFVAVLLVTLFLCLMLVPLLGRNR
jgi:biopolymer transport protein ExbD